MALQFAPQIHLSFKHERMATFCDLAAFFNESIAYQANAQESTLTRTNSTVDIEYDSDPMSLDTPPRPSTPSVSESSQHSNSSPPSPEVSSQGSEPPPDPESPPEDDDYYTELCSICFGRLWTEPPLTSCRQCFNLWHLSCMERWASSCLNSSCTQVTCPMCRAPWLNQFDYLQQASSERDTESDDDWTWGDSRHAVQVREWSEHESEQGEWEYYSGSESGSGSAPPSGERSEDSYHYGPYSDYDEGEEMYQMG